MITSTPSRPLRVWYRAGHGDPPRCGDRKGGVRFGFKTSNHYVPWARVRDIWTAADELEIFESGWLFDHLYPQQLSSQGPMRATEPCLEGWTMLAALSQATQRLRLGTLV